MTRTLLAALILALVPTTAGAGSTFVHMSVRLTETAHSPVAGLKPAPERASSKVGSNEIYLLDEAQYQAVCWNLGLTETPERKVVSPAGFEARVTSSLVGAGGGISPTTELRLVPTAENDSVRLYAVLTESDGTSQVIVELTDIPAGRVLLATIPSHRDPGVRRVVTVAPKLVVLGPKTPIAPPPPAKFPALAFGALTFEVPTTFSLEALGGRPMSRPLGPRVLQAAILEGWDLDRVARSIEAVPASLNVGYRGRVVRQEIWAFSLSTAHSALGDEPDRNYRTEIRGRAEAEAVLADLRWSERGADGFEPLTSPEDLRLVPATPVAILSHGLTPAGGLRLLVLRVDVIASEGAVPDHTDTPTRGLLGIVPADSP